MPNATALEFAVLRMHHAVGGHYAVALLASLLFAEHSSIHQFPSPDYLLLL